MIAYGKQFIDEDDINAVIEALKSPWLTQGPRVEEFEKMVAAYVGAKYAVAMSSWTSGLHMACIAANVGPKDSVVTSPLSFVASSNCAVYVGAKPAFADIDPTTLNISPENLERECQRLGNVRAIIPVHFGGLPCEMEKISAIAKKYNAVVIEDAAHAIGAQYPDGSYVGNCKHSLMTGFSFHPVKNIACGEGGMITTNNRDIYLHLLRCRSHGINKADDKFFNTTEAFTDGEVNPWYYEMQEIGFNYRLTDIQSALGMSQFKKLEFFLRRRREIAEKYDLAFSQLKNLKLVQQNYRKISGNHLYLVRVDFDRLKTSRSALLKKLKTHGILGHVHYIPIPMQPFYKENYPTPVENYRECLAYYRQALTLPFFPSMTDAEVETVISAIRSEIG